MPFETPFGMYPTLGSFLADVVSILREEVEEFIRLGATYIEHEVRDRLQSIEAAWDHPSHQ